MGRSDLEKLFDEKNKVARLSQIKEIVFGAEDGLLVPLGVVSGVHRKGEHAIRSLLHWVLCDAHAVK